MNTKNVLYFPPKFRGDSDRIRREGHRPKRLKKGHRVGHLVLLTTPRIEPFNFDHIETMPERKRCMSSYCVRCWPKLAAKKFIYSDKYCRVKCDCGTRKMVGTYSLRDGTTLSCGNCAFTHRQDKEELEAGIRAEKIDCNLWCCTSARFYAGKSPYSVKTAA
jgi:hypothetical protein